MATENRPDFEQDGDEHSRDLQDRIVQLCRETENRTALLDGVLNVLIDGVAESASIDLVEEDGSIDGAITRHRDPQKQKMFEEMRLSHPLPLTSSYGYPRVIKTGKPQFIPGVTTRVASLILPGAEDEMLMDGNMLRSYICVPMIAHGRTFGALTVAQSDHKQLFTADTLVLLEDIAALVALALDGHEDGIASKKNA